VAAATTKIAPLSAQQPLTPPRRLCAMPPPTPAAKIQANRVVTALRTHRMNFRGKTTIPVRWHIIHRGQAGNLSEARLKSQVNVLNKAFTPIGFEFKTIEVELNDNPDWFGIDIETDAVNDMKSSLGKDQERCLNLFTCEPANGILGFAAFPWYLRDEAAIDGVVLHHASLPGGQRDPNWPFDLGMTAVHEVGHWAGLYHTFQGGCEAPGDDVEDTPFEARSAFGCPLNQPSACPGETRFDPVENYMDYSDDACMKHFTKQQIQRARDMVGYYRYKLSPQTARSSQLEQLRATLE
jgi:hypothetical protein